MLIHQPAEHLRRQQRQQPRCIQAHSRPATGCYSVSAAACCCPPSLPPPAATPRRPLICAAVRQRYGSGTAGYLRKVVVLRRSGDGATGAQLVEGVVVAVVHLLQALRDWRLSFSSGSRRILAAGVQRGVGSNWLRKAERRLGCRAPASAQPPRALFNTTQRALNFGL